MITKKWSFALLAIVLSSVLSMSACHSNLTDGTSSNDASQGGASGKSLFANRETVEKDNIEINTYTLNDNTNYDAYTYFVTERLYNEYLDIGADVVSVYPYGFERQDLPHIPGGDSNLPNLIKTWSEKGYQVDLEIAAAHDFMKKYVMQDEKNRMKEVQIDKNGTVVTFAPTICEMVPNKNWEDYLFEHIDKALALGAKDVGMEESGFFPGTGYSEAFKKAWQSYYNEPWKDPESSPLARFQSEVLKQYLFRNQYDQLAQRVSEKYPDSRFFYVNHSMFANTEYGNTVDVYGLVALPSIFGVEGQVWSDTVRPVITHRGETASMPFEYGWIQNSEFATYQRQFPDKPVRIIGDPKGDALGLGWDTYEKNYLQNLVSQLLCPEFVRFQTAVWPERIFQQKYGDEATLEYKRIVQNIFTILDQIHEKKTVTVGSGSTGIAMAFSANSNMHHDLSKGEQPRGAITLGVSLIEKGIPVQVYALESFKDKSALDEVKTLVLSYDFMKPENAKYNQTIADWVRGGGSLLFIGAKNEYTEIPGAWWDKEGFASAEEQLFDLLGVSVEGYGKTTPAEELTDGAIKVNQAVGNGHVMVVEYPTWDLCLSSKSTDAYMRYVQQAHEATGHRFITTEYIYAQRGDIEIYKALSNPLSIQGNFVDMLAQNQDLITEKRLQPGDVAILKRVEIPTDDTPKLLHTTGFMVDDSLAENETSTVFTTKAMKGSETISVFYSKKYEPQTITMKDAEGNEYTDFVWVWDERKRMLRLKHVNSAPGVTISVEWAEK